MENETAETGSDAVTASGVETAPPEPTGPAAQDIALGLWDQLLTLAEGSWRPTVGWQVLIVLGVFLVAHVATRFVKPRWEAWLRAREG